MSSSERLTAPHNVNKVERLAWSSKRILRLIGQIALTVSYLRSRPPRGFEFISAWPPSVPMSEDSDEGRAREKRYQEFLRDPHSKLQVPIPGE